MQISSTSAGPVGQAREDLHQLQLVVEVVLEPEHDPGTGPSVAQLMVAAAEPHQRRPARPERGARYCARTAESASRSRLAGTGPSCSMSRHGSTGSG